MSVVYFDSFGFYDDVHLDERWDSHGGSPVPVYNGGRRITSGRVTLESGFWLEKEIEPDGTVIVGVATKRTGHPTDSPFIQFKAGTDVVGCVRMQDDGSIDICKGNTDVLASSSAGVVLTGDWYYIEAKYIPRTSTVGEFKVHVTDPTKNMVEVVSVTLAITSVSEEQIDHVRFLGGSTNVDIADLYICNGQGADRNTFLGDQRVDIKRPKGDGFHQEWLPDSGTRPGYTRLDELWILDDQVMLADGISARDSYDFTRIHAVTGDINAVQVHTASSKSDAGIAGVQHLIRLNDSDYYGAEQEVTTVDEMGYQTTIFEDNPQTEDRWTQKDVNNAEYGARPQ